MTTTVFCDDNAEEEEMMVVLLVDAAVTSARVTVLMLDILGGFSILWMGSLFFGGWGHHFFFLEYYQIEKEGMGEIPRPLRWMERSMGEYTLDGTSMDVAGYVLWHTARPMPPTTHRHAATQPRPAPRTKSARALMVFTIGR